jgi:hypothetical protein
MDPWIFLPIGYLFSIIIETPVLLVGLSPRHPFQRKLFAGIWLTACTYPIVVIVIPQFISETDNRTMYLLVAETFAPVAECLLFCFAFWEWTPQSGLRTVSGMNWSQQQASLTPPQPPEGATGVTAFPASPEGKAAALLPTGPTPDVGFLRNEAPVSERDPTARGSLLRDVIAITVANLASFGLGEVMNYWVWIPYFSQQPPTGTPFLF